jgi:predicted Zn-dependent protease
VFAGHAGSGEGADTAIAGRILFDRWRLRFESPTLALEFPLTRLQIQMNEEEGEEKSVSFFDPDQPGRWIQTPDARILQQSFFLGQANTRNQIRALQSADELKRRLRTTGWFALAFVLIAILGTMLTRLMVTSLVNSIPLEWEQEIGDSTMSELKAKYHFFQDPKMLMKLDRGVAPLVAALPRSSVKYQFYVMEHPLANAFALPGGHVVVTTGLLAISDRPEELAAVVAHEIAHVNCKHGFRKIISSLGPYLVLKMFVGNSRGLLGLLGEGSGLLVSQSFSQEYELEADSVGWDYMINAKIDPRGMIDVLTKLKIEQDRMRFAAVQIQAFSSHPATDKRIRILENRWRKLKDKEVFKPLAN